MAFTYIVRCADDSLYVGHTDDLASREELHNRGHQRQSRHLRFHAVDGGIDALLRGGL